MKKLNFPILITSSICFFTGALIIYGAFIKLSSKDASGRVLNWDGDYVHLKFASGDQDSVLVKAHVPYNKNKKKLKEYTIVPVRYNPIAPSLFEIRGVVYHTLYSEIFIFALFLYGTINLVARSKKGTSKKNNE